MKDSTFLSKLEYFDDEYFVILRKNHPVYLLYPNSVPITVLKFNIHSVQEIAMGDLFRMIPKIWDNEIIKILKNNEHYYNIINFSKEAEDLIDKYLLENRQKDLLNHIQIQD